MSIIEVYLVVFGLWKVVPCMLDGEDMTFEQSILLLSNTKQNKNFFEGTRVVPCMLDGEDMTFEQSILLLSNTKQNKNFFEGTRVTTRNLLSIFDNLRKNFNALFTGQKINSRTLEAYYYLGKLQEKFQSDPASFIKEYWNTWSDQPHIHYTNDEVMDGLEIFLNYNPTLTTFNLKSKEFGAEK
ncbi:hypothetical protein C2G38_2159461 [Gigaspora rosea]|uniref:GST N-terminal domain-containing protein n=1 Tax=Gigaspora rosea TaxID=44941 RepID=A0A397VZA1_9GLOM|nr:hypothetical protein C2G38_2159461 [Gigaspora rosea]